MNPLEPHKYFRGSAVQLHEAGVLTEYVRNCTVLDTLRVWSRVNGRKRSFLDALMSHLLTPPPTCCRRKWLMVAHHASALIVD